MQPTVSRVESFAYWILATLEVLSGEFCKRINPLPFYHTQKRFALGCLASLESGFLSNYRRVERFFGCFQDFCDDVIGLLTGEGLSRALKDQA